MERQIGHAGMINADANSNARNGSIGAQIERDFGIKGISKGVVWQHDDICIDVFVRRSARQIQGHIVEHIEC